MKSLLPLLFLLLSTYSLMAQEKSGVWSVSVYAAPQYFKYLSAYASADDYDSIFSYSLGVAVDYRLNKRWALNVGYTLQNGRESLNWSRFRGIRIGGRIDPLEKLLSEETVDKYILEKINLEIPFTVKYYFTTANKRLYTRAGIQTENLIVNRQVLRRSKASELPSTTATLLDELSSFNISIILGFGVELDLGKRFSVFTEPEWKINPFRGTAFFDLRKRLLGLRLGAIWRLNDRIDK